MSLKNIILVVLSASLIILGGGCAQPQVIEQVIKDVAPQEAFTLIQKNQNNPDFVIVDVRTPEEFAGGHIESAINLDFHSETFRDELNKLDKNKTYLIYCQSGSRSGNAREIMAELNFREVYNMLGGIIQWKAAGLPTAK